MIKVLFQTAVDTINVRVSGHAKSAPHGEDLVCASVSSITLGTLNALEHLDAFDIVTKEGLVEITTKHPISHHDSIVLHTMLRQLETIAETYPQYIKITKKGS